MQMTFQHPPPPTRTSPVPVLRVMSGIGEFGFRRKHTFIGVIILFFPAPLAFSVPIQRKSDSPTKLFESTDMGLMLTFDLFEQDFH